MYEYVRHKQNILEQSGLCQIPSPTRNSRNEILKKNSRKDKIRQEKKQGDEKNNETRVNNNNTN